MRRTLLFGGPVLVAAVLLAGPAHAANDQQIKAAIANGVAYLKKNAHGTDDGRLALAGLAMMEAGVDKSDPVIQSIAAVVRTASANQTRTYHLGLAIMFLDRIGLEADVKLIQTMGVRLILGQSAAGTWTYDCPSSVSSGSEGTPSLKGSNNPPQGKPSDLAGGTELDPDLAAALRNRRTSTNNPMMDDNSNTQFAILGLWAARGTRCRSMKSSRERKNTFARRSRAGAGPTP